MYVLPMELYNDVHRCGIYSRAHYMAIDAHNLEYVLYSH